MIPDALLEMSRQVLREAFGALMYRPVFTFSFSRGDDGTDCLEGVKLLYNRLVIAQKFGSVVCSTPPAIKSFFLKFIEMANNERQFTPLLGIDQDQLSVESRSKLSAYEKHLTQGP